MNLSAKRFLSPASGRAWSLGAAAWIAAVTLCVLNQPGSAEVGPGDPGAPGKPAKSGDNSTPKNRGDAAEGSKEGAGEKKKREKTGEKSGKKGKSSEGEAGGKAERAPEKGGDGKNKEGAQKGGGRMSLPLVKGHDSKGLNIPYFDEKGRRQMTFAIGVAELLDDDQVKMKEMRVETFGQNEESEMIIDLPSSTLDLNTRVLRGQEGVTVKRQDFELTGRALEFDTRTRKGDVVGEVRMLIYNQPNEDKPNEPSRKPSP